MNKAPRDKRKDHASEPRVGIVVCTYMGGLFIEELLRSLLAQTWPVSIYLFDDVSSDDTIALARAHLRSDIDHIVIREQNRGLVNNFEQGMRRVLDDGFDYIALCDQDDIWHSDRVEKGMRALLGREEQSGVSLPQLVHSDLEVVDQHNTLVWPSYLKFRGYALDSAHNLAVALGQNGVMGNTILMNAALVHKSLPFPDHLHVHDYWISLVTALFGERTLLNQPTVRYRIHHQNASNSAEKLQAGAKPGSKPSFFQRLLTLDFRLPFKEDSRDQVIDQLLGTEYGHWSFSVEQIDSLEFFSRYLHQRGGRIALIKRMWSEGFLKPGIWHRLRFTLVQLFTRRYG